MFLLPDHLTALYNACIDFRQAKKTARLFGDTCPELTDFVPRGHTPKQLIFVWDRWFAHQPGPIPHRLEPGDAMPPTMQTRRRKSLRTDRSKRRAPDGLLKGVVR